MAAALAPEPILSVRNLRTEYVLPDRTIAAVRDVSFDLQPAEKMGIVGESGSGKSALALSVLGLIDRPGRIVGGEIRLRGRNLVGLADKELAAVRGREIALVFQDPMTSLDPVKSIGEQIGEAVRRHQQALGRRGTRARVIELMREVEIPDAERRYADYPHQYSGGMRQRVTIAMALANDPDVLVADEPTTALDVTTQAQVMTLLENLVDEHRAAVILITHNMGLVAEFCDTVHVMYAGRLVERAQVEDLFLTPVHPYTEALLESVPRPDRLQEGPLPSIEGAPPQLDRLPEGCSFEPRCVVGGGQRRCREQAPIPGVELQAAHGTVNAECHFAAERLMRLAGAAE